jgi:SAM-dependent methyltransferase
MNILLRDECPICECTHHTPVHHPAAGRQWRLERCSCCDFVFLYNPPEVNVAGGRFHWEHSATHDKESDVSKHFSAARRARRLLAHTKRMMGAITRRDKLADLAREYFRPGPVLDIGCGNGSVVTSLPDWVQPWGIELSEWLAAEAAMRFRKLGGDAFCADALTGLRDFLEGHASGVIARSFLEHEVRPLEVLQEIERVLMPGGAVILKLPNYASINRLVRGNAWCGYRFPDHVNYFKPDHLRHLLERAGLRVVRFGFRDRFPTSDNMWCVATAK